MRITTRAISVTILLSFLPPPVEAAPIQWRTQKIEYVADGKALREVLQDFGGSQGLIISMSSDVEGRVEGRFRLAPADFLTVLALSYGFVWYYDGVVLHVVSAKDIRNAVVRMTFARIGRLRETISRLRLDDPRFPIIYDEEENTAVITGPQVYVDAIREVASHLEARTGKGGRAQVQVFKLEYAWASDRELSGMIVPGVASMLQAIYREGKKQERQIGGNALDEAVTGGQSRSQKIAPLVGDGAAESADSNKWRRTQSGLPSPGGSSRLKEDSGGRGDESDSLPLIVADPVNNSVVIRDLPERMELYRELIRSLDRRSPMVEIEVHILDIENDALREVGLDWTLSTSRFETRTGNGLRDSASYDGQLPSGGETTPSGMLLTAVLGRSGRYLLSRVAALQSEGRARISASPKVATLDNVTAVMDDKRTFHLRVSGFQSAQLYSVSAGTSLRVTPMMVINGDQYRIKLDVQIQDGRILPDHSVDGVPLITTSSLGTQAFVNQGESLLLGGFTSESEVRSSSGVPFLSSLPFVGALFQQNRDEARRRERLFLISPRLLPEGHYHHVVYRDRAPFAVDNVTETGNSEMQIEYRMHFERNLGVRGAQ